MKNYVTTKTRQTIDAYSKQLENDYEPSSFRYSKIGGFFDGIINLLKPIESNDIKLYLNEEDAIIDEKSIQDVRMISQWCQKNC